MIYIYLWYYFIRHNAFCVFEQLEGVIVTSDRVVETAVRQFNAEGEVCATYDSLGTLRSAVREQFANVRARARGVVWLELITSVDASAIDAGYFGFYEHNDSTAVSECTGATLAVRVPVYAGNLAAAVDELTAAYNAVFGQRKSFMLLHHTIEQ